MERLTRVADKRTLKLTHYGRKSGRPHEVTIWFATGGDKVILATANIHRQWVRNVQKTPQVRLSIAGEKFDGKARFLNERVEHSHALAKIRKKYWIYSPLMAIAGMFKIMGIVKDKTGAFEVTLTE